MKLFFHWLKWDLHRFRAMLLLWTLIVLGYAALVGWLQHDILTVEQRVLNSSVVPLMVLVAVAGSLLVWIFSADPAAGTASFWKLRPPAGYAVAGSKVLIAFVFFLLLPPLLIALSLTIALPEGLDLPVMSLAFGGLWKFALPASAMVILGSAAAGSPLQAGLRIGTGLVMIVLSGVLFTALIGGGLVAGSFWERTHAATPWLWFAAAVGVFMMARRSRTPSRHMIPISVMAFPCLFFGQAALVWQAGGSSLENSLSRLPKGEASPIVPGPFQIRMPAQVTRTKPLFIFSRRGDTVSLGFAVPLTGLPPGSKVAARWLDLKLTGPDGQSARARDGLLGSPAGPESLSTPERLRVSPTSFTAESLQPLSLAACRAEGTLRIIVSRPENLDLVPGGERDQVSQDGIHRIGFVRVPPPGEVLPAQLHLRVKNAYPASPPWEIWNRGIAYSLLHGESGDEIPLSASSLGDHRGPLVLNRSEQSLTYRRDTAALITARAERDFRQGDLHRHWRLEMSSGLPHGVIDLPVVLDLLVVPRQYPDERGIADLISSIPLEAATPSAERRRWLRYALLLAYPEMGPGTLATSARGARTSKVLKGLLQKAPADGLPDLISLVRENLPFDDPGQDSVFSLLRGRIATLATDRDWAALEAEPELLQYLRIGFVMRPTGPVVRNVAPDEMTDDELAWTWENIRKQSDPTSSVVQEAVSRGLPWGMKALAEIVELLPESEAALELMNRLFLVSDCPIGEKEAGLWIRKHAASLVFDPVKRRWVLPSGAAESRDGDGE